MRSACSAMIPRKRSRAATSSRAGPRNVSMNPARPAIGVFSSWLALATKSARIRSARRSAVVSCSTIRASEPSAAARGRRRRWATMSSSGGPASTSSTTDWSGFAKLPSGPISSSASMAARSCGWRNTVETSRSAPPELPSSRAAARLVRTMRRWRSTDTKGSGSPSTIACAEAARLSIEARWRRQPVERVAAAVASSSVAGAKERRGITGSRSSDSSPTKRAKLAREFR